MKIYMETYGCAASRSDSEIMAGLLAKNHELVDSIENSNAIIITTCDVKSLTEQKITNRTKMLSKKYPEKKIILVGCMADNRKEKLHKLFPFISLVGTHRITEIEKSLIPERLDLLGKSNIEKINLPRIQKDKEIGIVQISEGCRGFCTFCSTKLAKGSIQSFPIEKIIRDISGLVRGGCKKIYLTSQDTGAYGYDLEGRTLLPELLEKISTIDAEFSVRVGMMNPDNAISALPDFISAYRNKKIMKFLHLPVQSGNNDILRKMNRNYTVEQFKKIILEFRNAFPKIVVWTDVIIGFPGETEQQFQDTLSLLKEIRPNFTHISRFAKREGTPASRLKQFPTHEMKRRTRICSELVRKQQR